jgi:hypothetical protein
MNTRTTNDKSKRSKFRRKLSNRLQTAFLDYPYVALNSKSLVLVVSIMLMLGVSLDSSQAIYLFYSHREMFLSMEQNPFVIYSLESGYWYAVIFWEAMLGVAAILMMATKRTMARFFGLMIAYLNVLAPLTWILGNAISLLLCVVVPSVFLVPIMLKTRERLSAGERKCLTQILVSLLYMSG